ncbi:hypothetical protein R1flu_013850 [Riccia fluitans]|uniref:Uncharacterized protein n=1 Tax=Riccia fluitans TaxID=41844 RepID=A0ABD1YEE8_9MARC
MCKVPRPSATCSSSSGRSRLLRVDSTVSGILDKNNHKFLMDLRLGRVTPNGSGGGVRSVAVPAVNSVSSPIQFIVTVNSGCAALAIMPAFATHFI